jgi:hypothetical protein
MQSRVHAHAKSQTQSLPLCEEDMDSVLNSLVVTGIFLAMAAAVGIRLGRSGKPYGFAKVTLHIILFILVLSGVIARSISSNLLQTPGTIPNYPCMSRCLRC